MNFNSFRIVILFIAFLFTYSGIVAQDEYEAIEINENLYAIINPLGGNIAFLVTRKGVIVIDAGSSPNNGKKIIETIRTVTKKPLKYLILTHMHGDHINGLSSFPNDITIIAHSNLEKNNTEFNEPKLANYKEKVFPEYLASIKEQLHAIEDKNGEEYKKLTEQYNQNVDYFEDIKQVRFRKPDITFDDYYRLKLADERVMIEHPGPGHTNDNIVVKFSNYNVIHTGDLVFNKRFPYLIVEHGVDVYNWIVILDDLYKENIRTVIPGHGEIGRKIAIKDQSDYFRNLSKQIEKYIKAGYSLDHIKENIDPKSFRLKGSEDQFPVNIEVIYGELSKKGAEWWKF